MSQLPGFETDVREGWQVLFAAFYVDIVEKMPPVLLSKSSKITGIKAD